MQTIRYMQVVMFAISDSPRTWKMYRAPAAAPWPPWLELPLAMLWLTVFDIMFDIKRFAWIVWQ